MMIYIDRKFRTYYIQCDMCGAHTEIFNHDSGICPGYFKDGWVLVCGNFPDKYYCPACSMGIFAGIDLKSGPDTHPCLEDGLIDIPEEIQKRAKEILDKLDEIDRGF